MATLDDQEVRRSFDDERRRSLLKGIEKEGFYHSRNSTAHTRTSHDTRESEDRIFQTEPDLGSKSY